MELLHAAENTMSCAPCHSTCTPSARRFSLPSVTGEEMAAGELADLAGEPHRAISDEELGFAQAAGIEDHLAGRRVARLVLVIEAEVEVAERNPARLAAPPHMDDALFVGQQRFELGAGLRRGLFLQPRHERERGGLDTDQAQCGLLSAVIGSPD